MFTIDPLTGEEKEEYDKTLKEVLESYDEHIWVFARTRVVNKEHYMICYLDAETTPIACDGPGLYLYKHVHSNNTFKDLLKLD